MVQTTRIQAVREVIPAPGPCWQPWTLWRPTGKVACFDRQISWGFHGDFMGISWEFHGVSTWETTAVPNLVIANSLPLKTAIEFVSFRVKRVMFHSSVAVYQRVVDSSGDVNTRRMHLALSGTFIMVCQCGEKHLSGHELMGNIRWFIDFLSFYATLSSKINRFRNSFRIFVFFGKCLPSGI